MFCSIMETFSSSNDYGKLLEMNYRTWCMDKKVPCVRYQNKNFQNINKNKIWAYAVLFSSEILSNALI